VDWFTQAAIILGMFILRLGVPLAITLAVGYWLRKLDAKWQAEARARLQQQQAQEKAAAAKSALKMYRVIEQPCWVLKNCPDEARSKCPAVEKPYLPCWMARCQAEGQIPPECYYCHLFSSRQIVETVQN